MYGGWRNQPNSWWGAPQAPDGMFVRNPMYDDPVSQGRFWQTRRRVSLTAPAAAKKKPDNAKEDQPKQEEPSDVPPKPGSVRDLNNHLGHFSTEVTSAHGFAHIYTSTSLIVRMIWILIVLVGMGAFAYQLVQLVSSFLEFGTVTELRIVNNPRLEFPAVTVCNTNKLRRSSIEKSQHRHVLFIDDLTPLPYYIPCQEGDILCDNEFLCVRDYLECDGINHCGDGTDEKNCTYGSCGSDQIKCKKGSDKGYCIAAKKKCDGIQQCYDGEDEWDCTCRASEYKCERQGGCIRRSKVCDGTDDCVDKTDEAGCGDTTTCDAGFTCESNSQPKCVPAKFICDGVRDCKEGEDEGDPPGNFASSVCEQKPTATPEECTEEQFDCGDGQCIPSYYVCDQESDCRNRKDEMNCGNIRCEDFELACGNGWQCVEDYFVCDFFADCSEDVPGDEKNCTCAAVSDADVPLYSVNCAGHISLNEAEYPNIEQPDETYVKCQGGISVEPGYASYLEYTCNGTLTCADADNVMPHTCTSVYTECYVNGNGADYKGRVSQTTDGTPCVSWWTSPAAVALYNSGGSPLIGAHSFCRNPGGQSPGPWCFIDDDEKFPLREGAHWDYCTIPTAVTQTCHKDVELKVQLVGTRIEVQRGTTWGTVQDSTWTLEDAQVICRMLKLDDATVAYTSGQSAGVVASVPVYIASVDCQGTETTLLDCVFTLTPSTTTTFSHTNDVGVQCGAPPGGIEARKRRGIRKDGDPLYHREQTAGKSLAHQEIDNLNLIEDEGFIAVENNHDINLKKTVRRKRNTDDDIISGEGDGEIDEDETGDDDIEYYTGDIEFGSSTNLDDEVDIGEGIFICDNGMELPLWQACNDVPDCPQGEEEAYCTTKLCDLGKRPCRFEDKCIDSAFECDGVPDCEYRLDERFCDLETCPDQYFLCPGRPICIPEYYRCDTINDCGNNMDEFNCTFDQEIDYPDDPFEDSSWYVPYLDIFDHPDVFEDFAENYYRPNFFHRVKGEDPVDWKSFFTFSQSADYQDLLDVLYLTKEETREYGHQYDDFILDCTYDEIECTRANFTLFETDAYGNCYTFNYNPAAGNEIYSTKTGPTYGLRLTLNVQQDEYISLTGRHAGARVVLTPPKVSPLPEENGVTIQPGVASAIGLRYENISRLGGRYGDCDKPDTVYPVFKNGKIVESTDEAYDTQVCLKACLHDTIRRYCGCSDTILLDGPRCLLTNVTQDTCKQLMYHLHHSDLLGCDCTQQCQARILRKLVRTLFVFSTHESDAETILSGIFNEPMSERGFPIHRLQRAGNGTWGSRKIKNSLYDPLSVYLKKIQADNEEMHKTGEENLLMRGQEVLRRTRTYTQTTSQSKWPSNTYRPHLLRYIHSIRPESTLDINDRISVGDNLVRLEVFYEQLNFATTSESPAYTPYSLISDCGGTAGLYVGFSIITFLEFGVLFYQLICRCCFPWLYKEPQKDEPLQVRDSEPSPPPKFAKSYDWHY